MIWLCMDITEYIGKHDDWVWQVVGFTAVAVSYGLDPYANT